MECSRETTLLWFTVRYSHPLIWLNLWPQLAMNL